MHLNKSKAITQLQQSIFTPLQNEAVKTYFIFSCLFWSYFLLCLEVGFLSEQTFRGYFLKTQHLDLLIILLCNSLCFDTHHINSDISANC